MPSIYTTKLKKPHDKLFVLHLPPRCGIGSLFTFDGLQCIVWVCDQIIYIYIKEISKKKNKADFSQHSCTNVFTAVADLQVQCL